MLARLGIVVGVCMIYMDVAGGGEQVEQEEEEVEERVEVEGVVRLQPLRVEIKT